MRTRMIFFLLVPLLLLSCGSHQPVNGTVVNKHHTTPYSYISFIPSCSGKPMICTQIPIVHYIPEGWSLEVIQKNGEGVTVSVSQQTYEHTNLGDSYHESPS